MTKLSTRNHRNTTTINEDSNKSTTVVMANGGVTKAKRTRRTVPRDSPPQRSSIYRGVTRHRWTGRYEAHLWDKNCWNESQNKKGRQVYLGAYDDEEAAAHAYDLAALKYWGQETILNFPELKEMEGQSREEYIGSLRRKSSGFSRGVSKYRGVARHHHNGRWEARIGRVFGNKYLYLGTYATQEEAAIAYDMAAIEYRGLNAVTNFDLSRYIKWLKPNDDNNNNNNSNKNNNNISNNNNETHLAKPNIKIHYSTNNNMTTVVYGNNNQWSSSNNIGDTLGLSEQAMQHHLRPATTTTTLGLLLQSSKFKEMMEMTTAVDSSSSNQEQDQLEQNPKCSFPEEIQTYFEGHEESNSFRDEEDILFSGLNAFAPPLFQCDFDT